MSSDEIKTRRAILTSTSNKNHTKRLNTAASSYMKNTPFYKQLLEDYLGRSYTKEMYNELFDEVARDVDHRIKQMNLQKVIN